MADRPDDTAAAHEAAVMGTAAVAAPAKHPMVRGLIRNPPRVAPAER